MNYEEKELKKINNKNKILKTKKILKICQEYGMIAQVPLLFISGFLSIKLMSALGAIPSIGNILIVFTTIYGGINFISYSIYKKAYKKMEKKNDDFEFEKESFSRINDEIKLNNNKKQNIKQKIYEEKSKEEKIKELRELRKNIVEDTISSVKTYTK